MQNDNDLEPFASQNVKTVNTLTTVSFASRASLWLFSVVSTVTSNKYHARCENTNVVSFFKDWSIHDVGAMTAFISGLTFCWLQCAMSYKLKDHGVINSSAVCHSRAMLSLMITLCVAIFAAFQTKANLEWASARPRYHFLAKLKWGPQDPGYIFHVISSLAEWSMCGGMLLFMLTFTYEFQQIVITSDISSTEYW